MAKQTFLDIVKKDMLTESAHYYGSVNDNKIIFESIMEDGVKVLKTPNEFIDTMVEMPGKKKFVSFGYICGANLNIPQIKKLNPATNRMKNFDDYDEMGRQLGYDDGIGGVIKFTRLLVNFQTPAEVGKDYGEYKDKSASIRADFGVPEIKDKPEDGNYAKKIDYGTNGVITYGGDNDDLKGHMYVDQNVYSAYNGQGAVKRKSSTYYIIGKDGNVLEACDKDRANELFSKFGKASSSPYSPEVDKLHQRVGGHDSGLTALRKIDADDKTMIDYLTQIDGLKFIYRRFEFSSIVFMVGTCDGEKFYYPNQNLTSIPKGVNVPIDPKVFVEIANNKYKKTLDDISQAALEDQSNRNIAEE